MQCALRLRKTESAEAQVSPVLLKSTGNEFKKSLKKDLKNCYWFPDFVTAQLWFKEQDFKNHTFLLKGSRGIKIEKVLEM